MSRWGGFKKGKSRYSENWDEMKSPSSQRDQSIANTPTQFAYVEAKGIWNLESTTQFPKSNRFIQSLSFVASVTGTASVTIPAYIQAGDLAIYYTAAHGAGIAGTYTIPTGFTQVRQDVDSADSAMISGYKILTLADANRSLSGINDTTEYSAVLVFRPSAEITSATTFSVNGQATISDPTAQTIDMELVPSYKSVLAVAFMSGTTALAESVPVSMTNVSPESTTAAFYQIFNKEDHELTSLTVDMPDEGDNVMQSWGLAIN